MNMDSKTWRVGKLEVPFQQTSNSNCNCPVSGNVSGPFSLRLLAARDGQGVSVKQAYTSNHPRKMGTFKGKMEPPRKPEKFANLLDYPWQRFSGCWFCMFDSSHVWWHCRSFGWRYFWGGLTRCHLRRKRRIAKLMDQPLNTTLQLVHMFEKDAATEQQQMRSWISTMMKIPCLSFPKAS